MGQQISALMINTQWHHTHGVTIQSPILKKTIKQIGILYVDDTNLLAGLDNDDGLDDIMFKAEEGINQLGNSLLAI